jgi:hypothetical protein
MAICYNRRYGNAMFSVLIDTKTIVLRDLDSDSGNAFSIIRPSRTPFAFHSYYSLFMAAPPVAAADFFKKVIDDGDLVRASNVIQSFPIYLPV